MAPELEKLDVERPAESNRPMIMTVQCPSCSTSFPVDPNKVPDGGVSARCSVCPSIFRVEKEVTGGPSEVEASWTDQPEAETEAETVAGPTPVAVAVEDAPEVTEAEASGAVVEEEEAEPAVRAEPDAVAVDEDPVDAPPADPAAPEVESWSPPEDETWEATEAEAPGVVEEEQEEAEAAVEAEPDAVADHEAEATPSFSFGTRDPHEKAHRLARVLVSDMVMYNPEQHGRALREGTLATDFEEEVRKSWDEYVGQVGEEMARGSTYFTDALNEILAKGETIFTGPPS